MFILMMKYKDFDFIILYRILGKLFVFPLQNSVTGGKVTMQYGKSGVLNEEVRRKSQDTSSHSDVLYTEDRGRHKTRDPRSRGKSGSKSKFKNPNIVCYHCGKK